VNELFDFIKDYGGYAGAASVLGLAVLSLLYFAQAREVKRLREWAGRAPERAAELEQRVTSDAARRTITPMPQRTPPPRPGQPQTAAAQGAAAKPPAPAPANGQAPGAPVAAPAAVGGATAAAGAAGATTGGAAKPAAAPAASAAAPAAPAATPEGKPGDGDGKSPDPATTDAPKPGDATPGDAPAPAGTAPADATAAPATPKPAEGAPAGGAVGAGGAAAAAGAVAAGAAAARPATPPPGGTIPPGPGPRTAAARPRPAGPAQPLRSTSPSTTLPPARGGMVPDEKPRRTLSIVAGALAVLTIGLVLFFTVLSGDDEPDRAGDQPPTTVEDVPPAAGETATAPAAEEAARGDVQVAVFNGTTVNGLARRVAEKVEGGGWKLGTVDNAPPPEKSATIVWYAEGQRAQARDVARVIDVGNDAVQQMDQNVRLLDDDARVIVIVGADQQQG
jgi:hypothetical protein